MKAARENCSVGLLIGTDCTNVLGQINIKPKKNDGPYSFKTKLDLCIVGLVNYTSRNEICCKRIGVRQTDTNKGGKHFLQTKTTVKETDVKDLLNRLYNQAFTETGSSESKSENRMSVENVKFVRILENGTKMVNKYYRFTLLFRNPNILFLNNRC